MLLAVHVVNNSLKYLLDCLYSNQVSDITVSDFLKSLSLVTEETYKLRNEILLMGGFNLDMYLNEMEGRKPNKTLVDFVSSFGNLITEPTQATEKSKTLIDVILSSHVERFATCGTLSLRISDYDLIYTIRKCKSPRPKPRTIEYRSSKHFQRRGFYCCFTKRALAYRLSL